MDDKPPADLPKTSVRLISGLDDEFVSALRARVAAGPLGDTDNDRVRSSAGPLIEIFGWSRIKAAQVVELTVVTGPDAQGLVGILQDVLVELLPHSVEVHVRAIEVAGPVGGVLGDHSRTFATDWAPLGDEPSPEGTHAGPPGAVADEPSSYRPAVFVNGLSGTTDMRRALCAVADAWGVPVLLQADDRIYARRPLGEMTSSVLLGALRFTLTVPWSPESDADLLSRGFDGLVTRDGDSTRYRATRTLDHLLMDGRFIGTPDHFSACAELLERKGEPVLANSLRRLIDQWLRHRIWSINYVHEMVLHDEAHSVAVDRNVASLCEPLLNAPTPDIKPWDVFVLALAAWLHDWGHASAHVAGGPRPTDPIEVRNYHGALSALKIKQERGRHGISDDLVPGHATAEDAKTDRLRNEVALLCGHHQGWTSCSDGPAKDEFRPLPDFSVIKADTSGAYARSFAEDFSTRFRDGKATGGRGLTQMYRLIAILRLADAADIGAHRVPDFETQHENRTAALDSLLAQNRRLLTQRSTIVIRETRNEGAGSDDIRDFNSVCDAYNGLLGLVMSKADWSSDEINAKILDKGENRDNPPWWTRPPGGTEEIGKQLVRWSWTYSTHVVRQVAFYQTHRRIRAVIPTLEPVGGRFRLRMHVVPLMPPAANSRAEQGTDDKLVERVRDDILREYAGRVAETEIEISDAEDDAHKAKLAEHLSLRLRIDPQSLSVTTYLPDLTMPTDVPASPPTIGPLTALPFRRSSSDVWFSIGPSGSLMADPLLTARPSPSGAWPLSSTPDGRYIATCVESKVVVFRASDMSRAHEYRVDPEWCGATVLAIVAVRAGFRAVLTRAGRTASIDLASGYTHAKSATLETECPVRAISLSPGLRLVDATGTYTGADADLLSDGGGRWSAFDLIAHESGYLLATVISLARAVRVRHLSQDVRNDSLHEVRRLPDIPLADEPIDALWVRGLDSALPPQLAITTLGGTLVHAVAGLR